MWYEANSDKHVSTVGMKEPNPWGFYDMHGNVGEWCLNWCGSLAVGTDPTGPSSGSYRQNRGGSWDASAKFCTSSIRIDLYLSDSSCTCGFRLSSPLLSDSSSSSAKVEFAQGRICADGGSIAGEISLGCAPTESRNAVVMIDGETLLKASEAGSWVWAAQTVGTYTVSHAVGDDVMSATYVVTNGYAQVEPKPNPPMELVEGVSFTPSGEIAVAAKGARQIVKISGSGEAWTGATSDDWLKLNSTSGVATGKSIICTIAENTAVEPRVGYVYIAGQSLKVSQAGRGATVEESVVADTAGGEVAVSVSVSDETMTWRASSACPWIQVETPNGIGSGEAKFLVLPWNMATSRTRTVTVAGQTVTVTQRALAFECPTLTATNVVSEGESGAFTIATDYAVAWSAASDAEWLVVKDDGASRRGRGTVSWEALPQSLFAERTATITVTPAEEIGFEPWTFTVTQATATFVCPDETTKTVAATGSSGRFEIVTPGGVSWSATSDSDWLVVESGGVARTGSGTVLWTAKSQTTFAARTATIMVKTDPSCGDMTWTYVVTQEAATSELSAMRAAVAAQGGEISVSVATAAGLEWTVGDIPDWIALDGASDRMGSDGVSLVVSPNTAFEGRAATIRIAGKEFIVTQDAANVEIEGGLERSCDATGVDSLVVTVRVDVATAPWTVKISEAADGVWAFLMSDESPVEGDGTFELYVAAAEAGDALPRTATVTVGNATLRIVQDDGVTVADGDAPFIIPASWFKTYPALGGTTVAEWQKIAESAGMKTDASGAAQPVWHDYVAGTDPTDAASLFTASVAFEDGKPAVSWSPALNGDGVREGVRTYRVWGKANLTDAAWREVAPGAESAYRFFRVTVEMP